MANDHLVPALVRNEQKLNSSIDHDWRAPAVGGSEHYFTKNTDRVMATDLECLGHLSAPYTMLLQYIYPCKAILQGSPFRVNRRPCSYFSIGMLCGFRTISIIFLKQSIKEVILATQYAGSAWYLCGWYRSCIQNRVGPRANYSTRMCRHLHFCVQYRVGPNAISSTMCVNTFT